jgi:hypothetical protein
MELEISPEPSPEERAAIVAALEREADAAPAAGPLGWLPEDEDGPRP